MTVSPTELRTSTITPGGYSKNDFYDEVAITAVYTQVDFVSAVGEDFVSSGQIISNIGVQSLEFSYDGTNLHGALEKGESITFDDRHRQSVFVRSASGTTVRIWAW